MKYVIDKVNSEVLVNAVLWFLVIGVVLFMLFGCAGWSTVKASV